MKISVVIPCRDEEEGIAICINRIHQALQGEDYEIIVSDSSKDKSAQIAEKEGAVVVKHNLVGYGAAIKFGINASCGKYIIIGDADCSYDFLQIPRLIRCLEQGYDIVLGSRFKGNIKKKAMPALHRYVGNPGLNIMFRIFFRKRITDTQSGLRGITRKNVDLLDLQTNGMEFASEMLIKGVRYGFRVKEIPITYSPRRGVSKMRSFNDGWKHLRFMLLFAPNYLFLFPGICLSFLGMLLLILFAQGPKQMFGIVFDIHPILVGGLLLILGFGVILMWLYAKTFQYTQFKEESRFLRQFYNIFSLERSVVIGLGLLFFGFLVYGYIFVSWLRSGFGELQTLRLGIAGLIVITLGIQIIFSGFLLSILGIER